MKTTGRILAVLLVAVLAVALLVSCTGGGSTTTPGSDTTPGGTVTTDPTTTPSVTTPKPPTPSDVVEIGSAADLLDAATKIAANTDGYAGKSFVLTADITLSADFAPITGFHGVFDGKFHKISGLTVDASGAAVGLFATLENATVKNLIIEGADVANSSPECAMGILAGSVVDSTIDCVSVSGTVTVAGDKAVAGGLVGSAKGTTIKSAIATVTVAGAGAKAAGLVGEVLDGTVVVNAYADAAVTATAAVKASGVATKTADSAVAFVLVKDGDVVAKAEAAYGLYDYVLSCKSGAAVSEMGWNDIDFDLSGTSPVLKKDADKKPAAPAVKVDGAAVTVVYGEKLPASLFPAADENNVAKIGLSLGTGLYYPNLPVLNDMDLTTVTVDYSLVAGTFYPTTGDKAVLTVGQTVSLGDKALTRLTLSGTGADVVVYLADDAGAVYTLSFREVDGMFYAALTDAAGSTTLYAPSAKALSGAWVDADGNTLVIDGAYTSVSGKNGYLVSRNGGAAELLTAGLVKTPAGAYQVALGGLYLTLDNGIPTLTDGETSFSLNTSAIEGKWNGADGKTLLIADGKANGFDLKAGAFDEGCGYYYEDNGKQVKIFATLSGLTVVTDGKEEAYATGDFDGTYVGLVDGVTISLRIAGTNVFVDGAETPIPAQMQYKDGATLLLLTLNGKSYTLGKNGAMLLDESGVVFADAKSAEAFFGTYTVGSTDFVLANGMVKVGGQSYPLTLAYENGAYVMKADTMTFAIVDGDMTVTGYVSPVTGTADTIVLLNPVLVRAFFGGLSHEYFTIGYSMEVETVRFGFANRIMTINGKPVDYQVVRNGSSLSLYFVYDGKLSAVSKNREFLSVWNSTMGGLVPADLFDIMGKYYEFLTGSEEEGAAAPKQIGFNAYGTLTVNGKTYPSGEYDLTFANDTVVATFKGEQGTETVIFTAKTALYGDTVYVNYDRILPAGTKYRVVGAMEEVSMQVLKGTVGKWEYDEDEEEDYWVDAEYPLFGFRFRTAAGTYTSTAFTWAKAKDGTVTLTVTAADKDGEEKTFYISYNEDTCCTEVLVAEGEGEYVRMTSETAFSESVAGTYTNGQNTVILGRDGSVTLNGQRVEAAAALDFAAGVFTLSFEGHTLTLTADRREIAKLDDTTLYDARLANYAGVKLVAYASGLGLQTKYTMLLSEDGLLFNGVPVEWRNYNFFDFYVTLTVSGVKQKVRFQTNSRSFSDVREYAICVYPDIQIDPEAGEDGTEYRYFMPEVLFDNIGLYAASIGSGQIKVFSIMEPANKPGSMAGMTSFVPFTFTVGSSEYGIGDYTFHMEGDTLVLVLENGKGEITRIGLTETEDGTVLTLDGETAGTYERPDLSGYLTDKQIPFGATLKGDVITIEEDGNGGYRWVYNPDGDEYSREEHVFNSFGKWGERDLLFLEIKNGRQFVAFLLDDTVCIVASDIFNLSMETLTDEAGREVTFVYAIKDGKLTITAKVDNTPVEITTASKNYGVDYNAAGEPISHHSLSYITYTYGGKTYAVALNQDENTALKHPAVLLDADVFNFCYHYDSTYSYFAGVRLHIIPVYDEETGLGTFAFVTGPASSYDRGENITITKLDGVTNGYRMTYTYKGAEVVEYFFTFGGTERSEDALLVVKEAQYPYLGTHTVKVGDKDVKVIVSTGVVNGKAGFLVQLGDAEAVAGTLEKTGATLTFSVGDTTYLMSAGEDGFTVVSLPADQYRFLGDHTAADGYKATVTFVNGVPKVKFHYTDCTNVTFAADNSYLSFVYKDTVYRILWLGEVDGDKTATLEERLANMLGTYDDGRLTISLGHIYAWSTYWIVNITYDGSKLTPVWFTDTRFGFTMGQSLYVAEQVAEGEGKTVKVTPDVLSFAGENAALYRMIGNYSSQKIVVGYRITGTYGAYQAAFYVSYNGEDTTYTVDADLNILNVNCAGTVKHYIRYLDEDDDPALYALSDEQYAALGTREIGGHTLTVTATVSVSRYGARLTMSYLVDGVACTTKSVTATGGEKATQLTQKADPKQTFLLYLTDTTEILQQLTAEEAATLNMSSKTLKVDDVPCTLAGSATLNAAGTAFAVSVTFGPAGAAEAVTLTPLTEGEGSSFTYGGKTYYYLTSGTSYSYLVDAEGYAVYGEFVCDGVTYRITWGTKQLMIAKKTGESFGTAVELKANGTFYTFKDGSDSCVLAKDKNGSWVVSIPAAPTFKHAKNFMYTNWSGALYVTKGYKLDGTKVLDSFTLTYLIGEDGKASYAFLVNGTVTLALSEVEELANGEVIAFTLEDVRHLYIVAPQYGTPGKNSYNEEYALIEITEAQAAFLGLTTKEGTLNFTVLAKGTASPSSWSKNEVVVYVGEDGNEYNKYSSATFAEDGSLTFTYEGTAYKATVEDGKLVIDKA